MKTISIIALVLVGGGVALYYLFFLNTFSFSDGAKIIDKNKSNQYYFKNNKVVFVRNANFFSLGAQEIAGAEADHFEVLAYNVAKDKSHVYFDGEILKHADPKTFELIPSGGLIDKKYNYHIYTKDASHVFHFYDLIKEAEALSFQYLWGDFSKDENYLFYREKKFIPIVEHPKKMENDSDENYLRMGQDVYFQTMRIKNADAESFKVIKNDFSKDNNAVYYENTLLKNVDVASFKVLNRNYQRDENNLYYQTKLLIKGDPDSYEHLNTLFSKDKNNLYFVGSIVMDKNPKKYGKREVEKLDNDRSVINLTYDNDYSLFAKRTELKEISRVHTLYNNDLYAMNVRIIGADYKTFSVFKNSEEMYAADKSHVFYHSKIVNGADIASFQTINSKFAKDKNHVYYLEKPLLNINPDTFIYKEGMYGETIDKENDRLVYQAEY